MNEDQVRNAVVVQLGRMNWRVNAIKTLKEHGVDIEACHNRYGRRFLIETKGDPSSHVKSPRAGRDVRFTLALGQILTRMQPTTGYYYGIGFPDSYRDMILKRMSWQVAKHLKLHFFLVRNATTVDVVRWKDLKEYSQVSNRLAGG